MIRRMSLFGACLLLALPVASTEPLTQQHDPPPSLVEVKNSILNRLGEMSRADNSTWLVGQNAGHGNNDLRADYQRNVAGLLRVTGQLPSVMGIDLGYDEIPSRQTSPITLLLQFWQHGGLVTVSMHPPSPFHNSSCHDVRPVHWEEIRQSGSVVQKRWRRTLDRVADVLVPLRDAGVVVLWRPLHEMNGGWFWWCARHPDNRWTSREEFISLWQDMHLYFSDLGLDNLLWVYAPAVQTDAGQRSAVHYYPGDEYVDVVGLDWYDDQLQNLDGFGSYRQLVRLGKPLGLTEVGPRTKGNKSFDNLVVAREMQRHPRLGFAVFWHSWPGGEGAIIHNRNALELMTEPNVVTLQVFRKSTEQAGVLLPYEP